METEKQTKTKRQSYNKDTEGEKEPRTRSEWKEMKIKTTEVKEKTFIRKQRKSVNHSEKGQTDDEEELRRYNRTHSRKK